MDQARAEARAEAEAAAEQRFAAALALERAEFNKQVQLMLSCGSAALIWLASAEGACARRWSRRLHAPCGCGSMGHKETVFSRREGKLVFACACACACACAMPC